MAQKINLDSAPLRSVIPQSDLANFQYLGLYIDCITSLEAHEPLKS